MSSYITSEELRRLIPLYADSLDRMELDFIIEGWIGEVFQANAGVQDLGPIARTIVREGAEATATGKVLRQSGRMDAEETTRMEDLANKRLDRYAAARKLEREEKKREGSQGTGAAIISKVPW